jgi:sialic acid synthase SpsE
LAPKYYYNFLGKKASKNIEKGTAICWDLLNE